MAQNIYDDPQFFAGYSGLRRSVEGLAGAPEWPVLRVLLPDLDGRRVVDLGCGFGWFCRFAREAGAAEVLGVDLSENMLARAREMATGPAITYRRVDLEELDLPPASFDLAYSSLAFHYVADLPGAPGDRGAGACPRWPAWSSRPNTRSTRHRAGQAGLPMPTAASHGRSTNISSKGRAGRIGLPRGSSSSTAPSAPISIF
jgi:SAM-dependent methyltransferase